MITKNMSLTTYRDADFWASDILESTDHTDAEQAKLSDWIWNNKPAIGCTIEEHPINGMSSDDIWDLLK